MLSRSKKMMTTVVIIGLVAIMTGCGDTFKPLPDEEKYAYIHALRDKTGYASSGEVLEESYDTKGGVFATSFWKANIKGEGVYLKLKTNLEKSEKSDDKLECYYFLPEDKIIQCYLGVARLSFGENGPQSGVFELRISDATGGRGSGE